MGHNDGDAVAPDGLPKKLESPAVMRVATEEYRKGEDTISQFIAERAVVHPSAEMQAGTLYAAYVE